MQWDQGEGTEVRLRGETFSTYEKTVSTYIADFLHLHHA